MNNYAKPCIIQKPSTEGGCGQSIPGTLLKTERLAGSVVAAYRPCGIGVRGVVSSSEQEVDKEEKR